MATGPALLLSEERLRLHTGSMSADLPKLIADCCRQRCSSRSTALPSPTPSDDSASDAGSDSVSELQGTTLIVRQVPREITRQRVVQALEEHGFGAEFDFLYCPLDYVSKRGFGYVLLNFSAPDSASRFRERFQGKSGSWLMPGHSMALDLVWARGENRQGLQANLDRYRNSPVMHSIVPDEFKPIALTKGRRVAFARPTEKLEAPTKLPRSVWKAWTAEKKRQVSEKTPTSDVQHKSQASLPALQPSSTLNPSMYWDRHFGLAFSLPLGFRGPPGLPQPSHLQLL